MIIRCVLDVIKRHITINVTLTWHAISNFNCSQNMIISIANNPIDVKWAGRLPVAFHVFMNVRGTY